MSKRWSFFPDFKTEVYNPYRPKDKPKPSSWRAPEHSRMTSDMRRDYRRNDHGEPVSKERFLVIDPRPVIMIPPRPTIMGYL